MMRFRLSVGDDVHGIPRDTSDFVFSRREQAARPTGTNIVEIFSLPPGGRGTTVVVEGARVTLKQILILWLRTSNHLSIRVAADVDPYGVYRFLHKISRVHTAGASRPPYLCEDKH